MVQIINDPYSGNAFGRIGKGIGQGLSEQLPKEVERYRLSKGLQKLGEEGKDMTPFQRFSGLLGIPGAIDRPQVVQSGAELLKQEGINQALMKKAQQEKEPRPSPFPLKGSLEGAKGSPSITTRKPIEETLENYIPKNLEQIQERAGELMNENPLLYGQDPDKALSAATQEDQQAQSINAAYQARRSNEQDVQNRIEQGLKQQSGSLGVSIPGNVYSKIEDKAINAVRPIDKGGEGLTEQQAKKKYGDELDAISREYKSIETNRPTLFRTPNTNRENLKSIADKFRDRGDQENLADLFVAKDNLSPSKASYVAWRLSDEKPLNNSLVKLPKVKGPSIGPLSTINQQSLSVSQKLAPLLGEKGSPLAVAEELKSKGYDPDIWIDYLRKNRKDLNLKEWQGRELDKPNPLVPTLEDMWLFSLSGLDKLLEIE